MKRRETYKPTPKVWDVIPGWIQGAGLIVLVTWAYAMNWER